MQLDEKETGRIEAFSDGVFAIAITLLILDLKVPKGLSLDLLKAALLDQWPAYLAFFISFASIGVMWINHHRLFTLIKKADNMLLTYNMILLFTVSVVPFPTALVAEYLGHSGEVFATAVYTIWGLVIALAFRILWGYASSIKRGKTMLRIPPDCPEVRAIHKQYKYGPAWYIIAIVATFINPTVALVICGVLVIFFAIPPKI